MREEPVSSPNMRLAWLYVALLFPVALLNYFDRQMLAAMKYSVMESITDIGSEGNWGYMLGQFKWVYALLSPLAGYFADRVSKRLAICGSLFVWSAVTWWTGQVETYQELLWARSLMGVSEAFYIPAALAMIAGYHRGNTRSRAIGLHQMGIYCGVIAGGFAGYIADAPALGWRSAFTVCGIFGMIYAVPLTLILRDPPAEQTKTGSELAGGSFLRTVRALFTNPSYLLLGAYFSLPALAGWVIRDWMPAILKQEFQIGQGQAGVSATLYWQLAAILGAALGGWLADRWMRRTQRGRIYVSAIGSLLLIPAIIGIGEASSLSMAIGFLLLFGWGYGLVDCNHMPILCQIVPSSQRALGYGLMNMVSITCGGLADWGFGASRDAAVPLSVIFGAFAVVAAFSTLLVLLIRPRPDLAGT
ncbi:MFS transporter [Planctomicrobium sp. SH664]|uniref:MFS transporter n=1 Tax=Planctomicrobium sp. SH664 TaxID=3448125 RepID=UPI003F5C1B44